MKFGIMIPSKGRAQNMRLVLPHWVKQDLPVHVVVETDDYWSYSEEITALGYGDVVTVWVLHELNQGVSFAMNACVRLANMLELDAIVLADDDVHVRTGDDVRDFMRPVGRGFCLASGGWVNQYGLWIMGDNSFAKEKGKMVPMNMSTDRLFAINPRIAEEIGNFNPQLNVRQSIELQRHGIRNGYFWYASTSVGIVMDGARYAPGGISIIAGCNEDDTETARKTKVQELERRDHEVIYSVWGSPYITKPPKKYSCNWRRFITDFAGKDALDFVLDRTVIREEEAIQRPVFS